MNGIFSILLIVQDLISDMKHETAISEVDGFKFILIFCAVHHLKID